MGRRKIEIKPIRDDRNRSVTFLKRKGGLFKKAHELSVLCSVDVAVVIFGHNKKLYEYSSSDINEIVGRFQYYGGAHEHKGPADFADKQGGDDDDDDDAGEETEDHRGTPIPEAMHPQMQHHPGFQHVRQGTPTASPPMPNGAMPQFQRGSSPLAQGVSRPSSRASHNPGHNRRTSSNLAPPSHPQHPANVGPPPASYAYMSSQPYYSGQATTAMAPQHPPMGMPSQATYPPPTFPPQGAQHPHMQVVMMQDERRQSMPPAIPSQHSNNASRHPSQDHLQPPPHPQGHPPPRVSSPPQPQRPMIPSPQPPQHNFQSPPMPQPKPLPSYAKSNIFTPIDDSRSMLAQHWGSTSTEPSAKQEDGGHRPQSVDVAALGRERGGANSNGVSASPKRLPQRSPHGDRRTASIPHVPQRSNTSQSDAKRPRLKVQIPNEASGDEAGAASAPDETSTSQPSNNSSGPSHAPSHGVVLPPPSPSAGALLSAGAQGPPNPFARPAPPLGTNPHGSNREINETPMSALPSRFVSDNLLPSPSSFYPEWGFGRSADNMLPSPLNFQTPVVSGQGWRDDDAQQRKRRGEEGLEGDAKKPRP